jgi:hypothetical protein
MAITIDHATFIISVPRNDLTLIQSTPTEIRQLDINWFRLQLKDLEDDPEGMTLPTTHVHNPPVTVGGVTLARVVELLAPYTVTFEDGQYAVNLTGANSNIGDRTNVNQVSVRSANSAGLVQTSEIEYASFQNGVWVDQANGAAGTIYPAGTALRPVASFADAKLIADFRGLKRIYIIGDATLDASADFASFEIIGQTAALTHLEIMPAANVLSCQIKECTVAGTLDGGNLLRDCIIGDINYVNGVIHQCMLNPGTIALGGTAADVCHILDCYSGMPGVGDTVIDCGGNSAALSVRGFSGDLTIINKTGAAEIAVDLASGHVTIAPTVTAGLLMIRGMGKLTDNSAGATVNAENLLDLPRMVDNVWSHPTAAAMITKLAEAWGRLGLDPAKPLFNGQTQITFGDIVLALTESGGNVTVTRQ